MIVVLLIAAIWNILNAEWDARKIKKAIEPNHDANAGIYIGITVALCFFTDWKLALSILCLRPLVFDQWLNVRRGKPFNYQPMKPDSMVDRLENKLFGHSRAWALSNLCYLLGFIGGIIIYKL